MAQLMRSIAARLRHLVGDRRQAPRHTAKCAARLYFSVSLAGAQTKSESARSTSTLVGHTRDLSETGLALIVPSLRLGESYLSDPERRLRIVLDLPKGQVELHATAVRHERLAEGGHLVGVHFVEMSGDNRARFHEYLRTLS